MDHINKKNVTAVTRSCNQLNATARAEKVSLKGALTAFNDFLSTTNEMQRYTIFFIVVSALHVSSSFSAHHQELKNCTCSIGY
jgi:hypothetical protein